MTDSSSVTATAPGATDASPGAAPAEADRLSPTGRRVRAFVTVAGALLLLAGTLWGQDDHFPFGPFRMYAHSAERDGFVRSSRLEGVNAEGERFKLTDASTGLRRAEIEGQIGRFREDGRRLASVADAYHARHPDSPELVLVEILQRRYQLKGGDPTGEVTEAQIAVWTADGFEDLADFEGRVEGSEPAIVAEALAAAPEPEAPGPEATTDEASDAERADAGAAPAGQDDAAGGVATERTDAGQAPAGEADAGTGAGGGG